MHPILIGILSGLLGVLVGAWLGHRFTITSQRRVEYNEVADQMFATLSRIHAQGITAYTKLPDDTEYALLQRRMSPIQRFQFESQLNKFKLEYNSIAQTHDRHGEVTLGDTTACMAALSSVIKCLHHK